MASVTSAVHDLPTKRAMGLVGLSFIWVFYFCVGCFFFLALVSLLTRPDQMKWHVIVN